jgi:hypothetical protein
MGHKPPPSFVIGATGPPSIADDLPGMRQVAANVEVIRANPRQVLPRNRGGWPWFLPRAKIESRFQCPLRPVLPDADMAAEACVRWRRRRHVGPFAPTGLAAMVKTMMPRRFLAPWIAEKIAGGHVVSEANGSVPA